MAKLTKKILGIFLAIVMVVSMMAIGFSASAAEEWSSTKASNGGYSKGDQVTYNGVTYELTGAWWAGAADVPGSSSNWTVVGGGDTPVDPVDPVTPVDPVDPVDPGQPTGDDPGSPVLTSVTVNVLQTRDPEEYMGYGDTATASKDMNPDTLRNFAPCKAITLKPGDDIIVYTYIRSGNWYLNSYDDCARIKVDSHGCITVSGASFSYYPGVTDNATCNYKANASYGGITLQYAANSGTQTIYTSQYLAQPTDGGIYGAGVDEATLEEWATLSVNRTLTSDGGDRQGFSVNYVKDLIAELGVPARSIARNADFEAYVDDLTSWYIQCKEENDDYMTHYEYQNSEYYLHDVYCQGVWDTMPASYGWAQDENTVPGRMISSIHNLDGYSYGLAGGGQNPWVLCDYLERNAGVAGTAGEDWQYGYDEVAECPYLWNAEYGIFLTYENAQSLKARCDYVNEKDLAGCIIWEISGDQTATYEMTAIMRDELKNNGKQVLAYFTDWSVYNKYHQFQDPTILPWDKLTVINYSFFQVGGYSEGYPERAGSVLYPANTIQSMDRWADDYTVVNSTDAASAPNMLLSMADMAAQYPDVKILASVGGWTRGDGFNEMVQTSATRATFINSVIDFMNTYTYFDGIDFDWEYPTVDRLPDFDDPNDMGSATVDGNFSKYADLMEEMRAALDSTFGASGRNWITTCAPADPSKLSTDPDSMIRIANACTYLNVMTYDYHGAFDSIIGYNSPLYTPQGYTVENDGTRAWSTDSTIDAYNSIGVPNSKLNIGTPFYSRGWAGVKTDENGAPMGIQDPTPLNLEPITPPEEPEDPEEPEENIFVFKINDANVYCVNDDVKFAAGTAATFSADGKTLVPVRAIAGAVGIDDLEYDVATSKITFTDYKGNTVTMTLGSSTFTISDGTDVQTFSITAPVAINYTAMLPLREVSLLVGGMVEYYADNSGNSYIVASAAAFDLADVPGYAAAYEGK